jgi:hypothetical protein
MRIRQIGFKLVIDGFPVENILKFLTKLRQSYNLLIKNKNKL